ncbi:hypothetical protein [Mangrovimonas spongiae]|uniref:Uncharacterized protein n=1 Tax=Mangrovimonas spongiae TaxID=2494697 RepID=A0A3R9NU39_9FLAO|nr:hypothetical protein [Mangrovimonas spongiae]RSK41762.1 hypothetical protein EJA19_02465 [Mangrovimonas spongiae]
MKKLLSVVFLMFLILSCGTTHKVIMDNHEVYEVKGDKIFKDGTEVTETLKKDRRDAILDTLEERLEKQEELEEQQEALEKAQKEAEEQQKEIEKELKEKEDAREAFFDAKEKLKDQKNKYERLHKNGKLSPNDEEKWAKKLKKLAEDVAEAKENLNKL